MGKIEIAIKLSKTARPDMFVYQFLEKMIPCIEEEDNPKEMLVEIHTEDEYGNNLTGRTIFEMIDKEFEKNKTITGYDMCRTWKINEFVIIMEVKQ